MRETINSLWIGRPLSLIEQLSITSFLRNGCEYHLYCYENIKNVPDGVIIRNATEILPASEIFYYSSREGRGSVAAFANLFRYKLLLERGGWWVDADVVCLRPFNFEEPIVFAGERGAAGNQITNAIIKLPRGHDVAQQCYETARREDRAKLVWGKTGPLLLNRIVSENSLQDFVKPPDVFCPLNYWEWESLLSENSILSRQLTSGQSYTVHLWHEMWRRGGIGFDPVTGEFRKTWLSVRLLEKLGLKPKLPPVRETFFGELLDRYGTNQTR
jgi:Alpha 1,4-glycosyltransferase conserved region/Glycosyltransferase sugar-binding region containing DXD motif